MRGYHEICQHNVNVVVGINKVVRSNSRCEL